MRQREADLRHPCGRVSHPHLNFRGRAGDSLEIVRSSGRYGPDVINFLSLIENSRSHDRRLAGEV